MKRISLSFTVCSIAFVFRMITNNGLSRRFSAKYLAKCRRYSNFAVSLINGVNKSSKVETAFN